MLEVQRMRSAKSRRSLLHGIVVPLATPLTEAEDVDVDGLRRLVRHVIDGGVSGIFLLGSSGEFPALSASARDQLIQVTMAEVAGAVSVFVGVSHPSTREVVRQARSAEALGIDAVVVSTPYYYGYGPNLQAALKHHFESVIDAIDLPVLLYNIPQLTHLPIALETVRRLAERPSVVGIKDSQGDLAYFERLVQLQTTRPEFSVAQGRDAHTAVSLFAGARAAVISSANIAPALARRLFEAATSGNVDDAMHLQHQLMDIQDLYRGYGGPVGIKSCLEVLGICSRRASQPFLPMAESDMAAIRETLDRVGVTDRLSAVV